MFFSRTRAGFTGARRLSELLPRISSHRGSSRSYKSSNNLYNQEIEKKKYDHLLRQQLVQSTLQNNAGILRGGGSLRNDSGPSFKTVLVLIMASTSITMAGYVYWQLVEMNREFNHIRDASDPEYPVRVQKSIFLPLFVDCNWLYKSRYKYPSQLHYFDSEYAQYLEIEMSQLNANQRKADVNTNQRKADVNTNQRKADVDNYFTILQQNNIKYKVLEELSVHNTIRHVFGLPLNVNLLKDSEFDIWVEPKYPTVSGISFDVVMSTTGNNKTSTSISPHWSIKSINIYSIIDESLVGAGLKLERLNSSEAQAKTHEQGSGRIHEVPVAENSRYKHRPHTIFPTSGKPYNIVYTGSYGVTDTNDSKAGVVHYKGIIDFDHLSINKGIKITELVLTLGSADSSDHTTTYKLL